MSTAERWALWWHLSPVAIAHNSSWVWWLWKNSPTGKATFSIQNSSRKAKMRVCNDCLFIVFKMQNYKIIMNCKKKMSIILIIPEMPIMPEMPIINFGKVLNLAKVYTAKWRIGVFGRYRRSSEERREGFWWKKAIRRVGVAYRELIGSLYESWTIGIERVYKCLKVSG